MNESSVTQVRKENPLIHHLTNQVVMNFTANGLLSFGGSPIMAKESLEMKDIAKIVDGILINIGTLTKNDLEAMLIAGKIANQHNIPVVLDPVGVSASEFRTNAVNKLLKEIQFTAIKGNAGEMAFLVDIPWQTKGVESIDDNSSEITSIASKVAEKYKTIAIITGETDIISDGTNIEKNKSGHVYLTKITGTGCLLGSLITASLAVSKKPFQAITETVSFYGRAAEYTVQHNQVNGSGTFMPHFLDALSLNLLEE